MSRARITGCAQISQMTQVAQRLLEQISRRCALGEVSAQVSVSLGIAVFPEDGENPAELLRCEWTRARG